jgi:hypothetical protein
MLNKYPTRSNSVLLDVYRHFSDSWPKRTIRTKRPFFAVTENILKDSEFTAVLRIHAVVAM